MKFIVDENLPRRVAAWVSDLGHQAHHVSDLGLLGRPDDVVWAEAVQRQANIITRDADFIALASRPGQTAVVRLLVGNCSTPVLLARLEAMWPEIERQLNSGARLIEAR